MLSALKFKALIAAAEDTTGKPKIVAQEIKRFLNKTGAQYKSDRR